MDGGDEADDGDADDVVGGDDGFRRGNVGGLVRFNELPG